MTIKAGLKVKVKKSDKTKEVWTLRRTAIMENGECWCHLVSEGVENQSVPLSYVIKHAV